MIDENYQDEAFEESLEAQEEIQEIEAEAQEETQEEAQEEQQKETPEQKRTKLTDAALKAVNKKHFLYKEEERKRIALEQENAQLRAQYAPKADEIPPMPEYYDPDYETKVKARDEAIARKAQNEAQQAQYQALQYQQQLRQQQEYQEAVRQSEAALVNNAKKLGITQAQLMESAQTIAAYGLNGDIGLALMSEPDGALIINYLGSNPAEVEKIAMMNPYQAGAYIASTIRAKASNLRPKTTHAPAPSQGVKGKGDGQRRYQHIGGVTFE